MTSRTRSVFFSLMLGVSMAGAAPASDGPPQAVTREQLVGAWRLVKINYRGPDGATRDPFYQQGSSGILIYDASGWMSVHIAGPDRRGWKVPQSRTSSTPDAAEAPLKAAAFDTYYAYFGTWEFDPRNSVVTHHLVSALIPGETGRSYSQAVTLDGRRLTFTTHAGGKGAETVRRKVWMREVSR